MRRVWEQGSLETSTGVATFRQERRKKVKLEVTTDDNMASTSNTVKDVILVEADVHGSLEGPSNKKGDVAGLEGLSVIETT